MGFSDGTALRYGGGQEHSRAPLSPPSPRPFPELERELESSFDRLGNWPERGRLFLPGGGRMLRTLRTGWRRSGRGGAVRRDSAAGAGAPPAVLRWWRSFPGSHPQVLFHLSRPV